MLIPFFSIFSKGSAEAEKIKHPKAENGVLDLSTWNFEENGSIKLEGEWLFFWMEQLDPANSHYQNIIERANKIILPGYWTEHSIDGHKFAAPGYATYFLKIILPDNSSRMAVNIGNVQTSYSLYIDGKKRAGVGIPGTTKESTTPHYSSKVIAFNPNKNEANLLIHVSNFHHRDSGLWATIRFGNEMEIRNSWDNRRFLDIFLGASIFIMAAYHIFLFWFHRRDKAALYFGFFCLLLALRAVITGELTAFSLFPDIPWSIFLKIEYTTFYFSVPLFLLYLYSLFNINFSKTILKIIVLSGVIFTLFVLLTPTKVFTRSMEIYQIITLFVGSYGIFILIKAVRKKERSSMILLFGFLLLFLIVVNDILYANQIIATGMFAPFGLLIFLFSQAVLLARRSGYTIFKFEQQTIELGKTNLLLRDEIQEKRKLEKDLLDSYKQVEQSRDGIILGLAKLAEYRDEDTGEHLERIREYCRVLTEKLAEHPDYMNYISDGYIKDIYKSSILHDIGKVGVHDNVLLKPGKLTDEEFEKIKMHPRIGGDAISNVEKSIDIRSFLTLGKEIAYSHHEKWDGSGYPFGLNGKDIPLSARITALADVYDALSSERPYKKAFSEEKTAEIILQGRGTHFDPDIVDSFIKCRSEFKKIRQRMEDD
ncbi:MAG: HD domain-containing protein [Spirochaetales bacterium]|nr:HD domain-containing protein [Spirochaetales bacterium]